MKKLLFITLVGLAVVSCKKEEEETPTPAGTGINFVMTYSLNWSFSK